MIDAKMHILKNTMHFGSVVEIQRRLLLNIAVFLLLLFLGLDHAGAHRVNLFAWVEGDTVYVESKFSGGKKVKAGKIIVTDSQGTELLTGATDENGEFSFKVPKKTDLKIVLIAGAGHRAEWTIPASEITIPIYGKKPVPDEGTTFKGIIIGIGCIFGLTAVVAYIRKRKKQKN
jgi:nickel transport protein